MHGYAIYARARWYAIRLVTFTMQKTVEQIQPGCLLAIGENQPTHRDLVNWLHQLMIGVICKVYMIYIYITSNFYTELDTGDRLLVSSFLFVDLRSCGSQRRHPSLMAPSRNHSEMEKTTCCVGVGRAIHPEHVPATAPKCLC